jgi:predicted alpha/beta hydrolase family esterase
MKKVFIIHGFEGTPNGGWRPWLMAELEKEGIYACALPMPNPGEPLCVEWVGEIARACRTSGRDEIWLVGHSLGAPAILRYLESADRQPVCGAVLVSGPSEKNKNRKIDSFLETEFNFPRILESCKEWTVIQGDNDPNVPMSNAEYLAEQLSAELLVVPNGGHLNGSAGWFQLPQALDALRRMNITN